MKGFLLLFLVWAQALPLPIDDPGYCGIGIFETGPRDPFYQSGACPDHDAAMQAQKDHEQYSTNLQTQGKFILKVAETAAVEVAEGVYSLVVAVPFALLGAGVGAILMRHRRYRKATTGSGSGRFE